MVIVRQVNIGTPHHQAESDIVRIQALLIVLLDSIGMAPVVFLTRTLLVQAGSIGTALLVSLPLNRQVVVVHMLRRQVV